MLPGPHWLPPPPLPTLPLQHAHRHPRMPAVCPFCSHTLEPMPALEDIPTLVQQLRRGGSAVQADAALALARLVDHNPSAKQAIAAAGGIAALARLLRSSTKAVHRNAAHALMELTSNSPENCAAFTAAGGLPPLV